MKNKKGISAIVATVMIILITVAAVAIVWAAIIPMINNQLETGTLCFDAVSQIQVLNTGYTCYDGDSVFVQVKRGATDIDLVDIQFLISNGGTTVSKLTGDSVGSKAVIGVNGGDVYEFTGIAGADSVQVAPVITVGNTQKTCDATNSVEVPACN